MSREVTDTSGNLSPGKYKFTVIEEPKKVHMGQKHGYEFKFSAVNEQGLRREYKEKFPSWLVGDLLRALGSEEVSPGKFDWDTAEVADLCVSAEIIYEEFVNNQGKKQSVPKMKKITEEIPF